MVLYSMLVSALSQGLLYAPMALGVFVTSRILKTPDLTVDGSFVFGMTVCAIVTIAGHPVLALLVGTLAGALAGSTARYLIVAIMGAALALNGLSGYRQSRWAGFSLMVFGTLLFLGNLFMLTR